MFNVLNIDTETTLFYGFLALLILVIITVIAILFHSGFFTEIVVSSGKPYIGEVIIAYKAAQGPYKESGSLFTEAHTLLPQYRTLGVYYDDPKKKEPSRLRYIVGLILSENGEPVNAEHKKLLEEWDYKFTTFPSIDHAVETSFPFNSTISIIVAIFRVYPMLDEYIERRSLCAHPFIEVYDNRCRKIYFIGPLEKQDKFYVPEILESEDTLQEEDKDEEDHSVSWDESASYIKSDGIDSDSVGEDGQSISDNNEDISFMNEGAHAEGPSQEVEFKDDGKQDEVLKKEIPQVDIESEVPTNAKENIVGLAYVKIIF
ncbi:Testis-expressed sequence protein [Armadillidium vulgare]|nr:Testis-expressed sequence protein [Armadillidium vulgare]